jgi:hypothetical protein
MFFAILVQTAVDLHVDIRCRRQFLRKRRERPVGYNAAVVHFYYLRRTEPGVLLNCPFGRPGSVASVMHKYQGGMAMSAIGGIKGKPDDIRKAATGHAADHATILPHPRRDALSAAPVGRITCAAANQPVQAQPTGRRLAPLSLP